MNSTSSHIKHALFLALGLFIFGTAGYMLLMGWSLLDAMYMTTITLTTVGFREVGTLNSAGRIFTIALIGGGIITIAYTVHVLVEYVVPENIMYGIGRRRMRKRLARLKGHIIICGYGKIGQHVVDEFRGSGRNCVVIDRDAPEEHSTDDMIFVKGDATDEEMLKEAGLERAGCLVAAVGTDADNLFITMTARIANPDMKIVSRATDARVRTRLQRAGADSVVLPYEIGGRRIAAMVLKPSVCEFLDMTVTTGGEEMRIEEVDVPQASGLTGCDMLSADIRRRTGAVILAVKRSGGQMISNPGTDLVIQAGDKLLALGMSEQINAVRALAQSGKEPS